MVTPKVLEVLSRLEIGKVSAPVDTVFGFYVLQRTKVEKPEMFAMRAIRFPYDPNVAADDPDSEESVAATAARTAEMVLKGRLSFDDALKRYCCDAAERWSLGHGDPNLTLALRSMAFGSIARTPLRVPYSFVIPQRVNPELVVESDATHLDLPVVRHVDIDMMVRNSTSKTLASDVATLRPMLTSIVSSPKEEVVLKASLDEFQRRVASAETADERQSAYHASLWRAYDGISQSTYARFAAILQEYAARTVLAN
jgi:hypothetical protein